MRIKPKILIFAGSTRSGSFSQQLANAYAAELSGYECDVTRITLSDYPLPLMDQDLESEKGIPKNAVKLAKLFHNHDAIIMVTPEYNGSFTPLLKNTIDWVSRVSTEGGKSFSPYRNKLCCIASSSPGGMGGISSLAHLRDVLVRLGMQVLSEQVAIGGAESAYDAKERLADDRQNSLLKNACISLVEKATLLG